MRIPTQAVDPVTAPTTGHTPGCVWIDGTVGGPVEHHCPNVPEWDVIAVCEAGRHQKAGPTCNRHLGLIEQGRPDLDGHGWIVQMVTPLGGAA